MHTGYSECLYFYFFKEDYVRNWLQEGIFIFFKKQGSYANKSEYNITHNFIQCLQRMLTRFQKPYLFVVCEGLRIWKNIFKPQITKKLVSF